MTHSLSTLRYRLLTGPVAMEPLRVLEAHSVDWHGSRVTFMALGASHAVCLEREEARLTELLTCAPPGGEAVSVGEILSAEREARLTAHAQGWFCRVHLLPFTLHTEMDRLQGCFVAENRLEVAYPGEHGRPTPITRLGWTCEARQLRVETVHTYPEEGRGVRSFTLFERQEETR